MQQAAITGDKAELLSLLEPVRRAAEQSAWLAEVVDAGGLYRPARWTAAQALELLREIPILEQAGVSVRMPANWKAAHLRASRSPGAVGETNQAALGRNALLDFEVHLSVAGETLTRDEVAALLDGVDGLQLIRGQWVEVNRDRLAAMMSHYERAQTLAASDGLDFHAAMKLLAGGPLGAARSDDMGPGKTLQVLALLVALRAEGRGGPTLVVAPASLLGNRQAEAARFTPDLQVRVAHRSATDDTALAGRSQDDLAGIDLVLTTCATLARDDDLRALRWRLGVLDEARAIKNPGTRQTRAAKELRADARIAMTGTPVENRLSDLWSLMDFLNPGLLGGAMAFGRHAKAMASAPGGYAPPAPARAAARRCSCSPGSGGRSHRRRRSCRPLMMRSVMMTSVRCSAWRWTRG